MSPAVGGALGPGSGEPSELPLPLLLQAAGQPTPTSLAGALNLTATALHQHHQQQQQQRGSCAIEERTLLEFVIYGLLLNVVGVLGVLGNSVSVIVLSRPQMRSSSINYLLIGLATCDTVLVVLAVLLYGLPGINAGAKDYLFDYKFFVYPKIVRYLYPLSTSVQMATVYLTLTITMERYVAVCLPLRARSLCTRSRARYALALIALASLLYNLPRFWEIELSQEWHREANLTVNCVVGTELRRDRLYIALYVHWLYFFVYYALPFGALVVFNLAIYRNVRRANRDLRRLTRNQRSEIGLATMLLCVVVVFLICNLLPLVSNVYENLLYPRLGPPVWLVQLGNLLVTFNSGVNFVIYVIFGRKFKRVFLRIFCRVSAESGGLDCMGRTWLHGRAGTCRADSPDFQTTCNEDSVATNTSNLAEFRNSVRRGAPLGGSLHPHHGAHSHFHSQHPATAANNCGAPPRRPSGGSCRGRPPPPPPPPPAATATAGHGYRDQNGDGAVVNAAATATADTTFSC